MNMLKIILMIHKVFPFKNSVISLNNCYRQLNSYLKSQESQNKRRDV